MDTKIILGAVAILVIAGLGYFFLFQQPVQPLTCPSGQYVENGICVPDNAGIIELPIPELTGTFNKQYETIANSWQGIGFKEKTFHGNYSDLRNLSSAQLSELKESFSSYSKETDSQQVKDLMAIYTSMVVLAERQDNLSAGLAAFKSSDDYCSSLPELKGFNSQLGELVERTKTLSGNISSFVSTYPAEAKSINLNPLGTEISTLETAVGEQNSTILLLEEACGAT